MEISCDKCGNKYQEEMEIKLESSKDSLGGSDIYFETIVLRCIICGKLSFLPRREKDKSFVGGERLSFPPTDPRSNDEYYS